jgi:hypothetical protein
MLDAVWRIDNIAPSIPDLGAEAALPLGNNPCYILNRSSRMINIFYLCRELNVSPPVLEAIVWSLY